MLAAILLSLLLAQLGSPFVEAVVTGERVGDEIRVDLEVEVEALGVRTVLAHVLDPGGEQFTTPLREREPGRYGAVLTLAPADLVVVFEALASGDSVLSQPTTLTDLGLDPAVLEGERAFATVEPEPQPADGLDPTTRRWGWAALAAVATSLALLAIWAAGPRRGQPSDEPSSTPLDSPGPPGSPNSLDSANPASDVGGVGAAETPDEGAPDEPSSG